MLTYYKPFQVEEILLYAKELAEKYHIVNEDNKPHLPLIRALLKDAEVFYYTDRSSSLGRVYQAKDYKPILDNFVMESAKDKLNVVSIGYRIYKYRILS